MSETHVLLETTKGSLKFSLWDEVAPKTTANFRKLASEGFYDGTAFHRIIDGFMIQGGDPLTKDPKKERLWGTGDPGYKINAEFNSRKHVRGVISMARSSHPDSAGSQFFICLDECDFLNKQYTCFGELIEGEDVLLAIGKTPCVSSNGEKSKPVDRIEILSATLV
ncbi:MAG: peptidylprolyl isomerase [Puniceicoccaceae bacterium]